MSGYRMQLELCSLSETPIPCGEGLRCRSQPSVANGRNRRSSNGSKAGFSGHVLPLTLIWIVSLGSARFHHLQVGHHDVLHVVGHVTCAER